MTFGFAKLFFRAPNQRTKIAMNPIQSELLIVGENAKITFSFWVRVAVPAKNGIPDDFQYAVWSFLESPLLDKRLGNFYYIKITLNMS
jgi:hypothetical protein